MVCSAVYPSLTESLVRAFTLVLCLRLRAGSYRDTRDQAEAAVGLVMDPDFESRRRVITNPSLDHIADKVVRSSHSCHGVSPTRFVKGAPHD
ncbi:hypothetical protein B0H67DRAFT_589235 [Lasiosphaeris hirsuta]|uniref:Uncharacterized protein n=1 Tax=Lasiosphaeris hirsuta TaxID=260670 RepID=A0AA40A2F4_9PEZI|nr:hypothetical protein B0H67DRAFT_589235 [Lasiosphaeris hirsuta]